MTKQDALLEIMLMKLDILSNQLGQIVNLLQIQVELQKFHSGIDFEQPRKDEKK